MMSRENGFSFSLYLAQGFVFTVVSIIGITTAYPHGPPVGLAPEMCEMMAPDPGPKGHNATAQVTASPYVVETTATEGYKGGESYKGTNPIRGYIALTCDWLISSDNCQNLD